MANMLNFKFGPFDNLKNQNYSAGTVYVTTDEQAMYIDLPDKNNTETRIRIGDIIVKESVKTAQPPFATGAFYYFVAQNALCRWDGAAWAQINSTSDVEASISTLNTKVDQEIDRSTAADSTHTKNIATNAANIEKNAKAIADNATAIGLRVTTSKFEEFKTSNKNTIDAVEAKANNAQNRADSAYALAGTMLPKAGGTMNNGAEIKMNSGSITGLANLTSDSLNSAAANKNYVDAAKTAAINEANTAKGLANAAQNKADSAYALAETGNTAANNAMARANSAYSLAESRATVAQVEAVLGTSSDTSSKNTVYGAKQAAKEALEKANQGVTNAATAQAAAEAAQSTANTAKSNAATADAKAVAAQNTADAAQAAADAANDNADIRLKITEFEAFKTSNNQSLDGLSGRITTAQDTANTAKANAKTADDKAVAAQNKADSAYNLAGTMLPKAGGTMSNKAEIKMNSGSITGLANLTSSSPDGAAANKKYVDDTKTTLNGAISNAQNRADSAYALAGTMLPKAGGTMTGDIVMGNNKITGLAAPGENDDTAAANKKYVDDAVKAGIATSDAMVYKGVIGSASALSAITTANKGDTYKISTAFTVGSGTSAKKYRVGDILINSGADGAAPTWDHITSGYEDDYLQKIAADATNATIHLTDGVTNTASGSVSGIKFVGANTSNIVFSVTAGTGNNPVHTVTASMEWGTF